MKKKLKQVEVAFCQAIFQATPTAAIDTVPYFLSRMVSAQCLPTCLDQYLAFWSRDLNSASSTQLLSVCTHSYLRPHEAAPVLPSASHCNERFPANFVCGLQTNLKLQKRLASSIYGCGRRRIWLDPNESSSISVANSRVAVKKLIKSGLIIRLPTVRGARVSQFIPPPDTAQAPLCYVQFPVLS